MFHHQSPRSILILSLVFLGVVGIETRVAAAADKIGIVLMHGLQGMPNDKVIGGLGHALESAGYDVIEPEMCWSRSRAFDKPYTDCLAQVDASVAKLKAGSATKIVIAGMSIGGNGALGYAATHEGLAAVIAIAPAADPMMTGHNPVVAKSIERAQGLVANGKGDVAVAFDSVNGGRSISVEATPKVFLSFYGADSPGRIPTNTAKIKIPLLWVAGTDDPSQRGGPGFAFDKAPPNPLSHYETVTSDHLGTPDAGKQAILNWLKALAAH